MNTKAKAVMEAEELRALMAKHGLTARALAEATKYSPTHINDLCSGRRTISERVHTLIMSAIDKHAGQLSNHGGGPGCHHRVIELPAAPVPPEVSEHTEYFQLRSFGGRRVMTVQDIADGFQVDKNLVEKAFSVHRAAWVENILREHSAMREADSFKFSSVPQNVETLLSPVATTSGVRHIRLFTLRGAMRFAFYLQSGVVEQVRSHILDLLEKEAQELASSSQGNQQWTPAANAPHYGPPAWLPAMMEALGANVIGMKGEIQSLAAGLHQKVDREEVLHLVESKVHASADINQGHIAQEVFNLQKQDKNAHRLKRNKLHDRVNRLVYLRLAKHHGGVIPDEIKSQERKELNRRVNTAVAGGHGLKSWPRDSYDDQDFQAAHIALDKYAREHGIQEATQLKVLEGGKL